MTSTNRWLELTSTTTTNSWGLWLTNRPFSLVKCQWLTYSISSKTLRVSTTSRSLNTLPQQMWRPSSAEMSKVWYLIRLVSTSSWVSAVLANTLTKTYMASLYAKVATTLLAALVPKLKIVSFRATRSIRQSTSRPWKPTCARQKHLVCQPIA